MDKQQAMKISHYNVVNQKYFQEKVRAVSLRVLSRVEKTSKQTKKNSDHS